MTVQIDADLAFEVDGIRGRLMSDGSALRVIADQPLGLLREARRALAATGASTTLPDVASLPTAITLEGPHGPVARIRAGEGNLLGRVLTGTSDVAVSPSGAASSSRFAGAAIALLGAAAIVLVWRAARSR